MIGKIGFRIEQEIERAPKERLEMLRPFACAQVSDGTNKFYTMDSGIRQMFPAARFIGPAITVKTRSADNLLVHKAISLIQPGDVLVIDTQGYTNYSLMGELMVTCMEKLGLAAIVADGVVVIPKADIADAAENTAQKAGYEKKRRESIAQGNLIKPDIDKLLEKKWLVLPEM